MMEAGIERSVSRVGDSYDNVLAETIHGLYKSEVIHHQHGQSRAEIEMATLQWVDRFNHRRLLEPYLPPIEAEMSYYQQLPDITKVT